MESRVTKLAQNVVIAELAATALSPAAKAAKTRASFLRKVEVLEEWASMGLAHGVWYPRNLAEFAAWTDPSLGVTAWRKSNIVVDPKYSDLRQRYNLAFKHLSERLRKPVRGGHETHKRVAAERGAVSIAQQLVAERFAHNATRKELRLALANKAITPAQTGRARLRLIEG